MRKSTPRAARNPVDRRDQGDRQGGARSRFLVLWDIDGTLVQAGDVGRDIFTEAFQAVLGRAPDQVAAHAQAIYQQVVVTKIMPMNNTTGMTDEERALIGRWFQAGAKTN